MGGSAQVGIPPKDFKMKEKKFFYLSLIAVSVISFAVFLRDLDKPSLIFWDEHYHLSSAQRYIKGDFFMELHPPLGKLLIALGEQLWNLDDNKIRYASEIHIPDTTANFSMKGYRFFPALLAALAVPLLFLILLKITGNIFHSLLFSLLYVFDNALVVHFRSAMLDGILVFFSVLAVYAYMRISAEGSRRISYLAAGLFGFAFACAVASKIVALVLLTLLPLLFLKLWPNYLQFLKYLASASCAFLLSYVLIWGIHFQLASKINPALENGGYFTASEEYKKILNSGENTSINNFYVMWREALRFSSDHAQGVPKLDLCKDPEDGSPFYFWPFGARSIDYVREEVSPKNFRYLYLQANPVVWLIGLLGVLMASAICLADVFFASPIKLKSRFTLNTFLALYYAYMIGVSQVGRVMYLYHYFIPLVISLILAAIVFYEVRTIGKFTITAKVKNILASLMIMIVISSFVWYSPLTYFHAISNAELKKRALLSIWDLRCFGCQRTNLLAKPVRQSLIRGGAAVKKTLVPHP